MVLPDPFHSLLLLGNSATVHDKLWSGFRVSFHICVKGGPFMQSCYRDTKMEIQGLSHAQNIYCQHGAPQRTGSSPLRTTTGARSLSISSENEAQEDSESHELQSDNNNRTRTSTFRLLAENGSVLCLPVCKQKGKNNSPLQTQTANVGLRNMNTLKARELLRNMNNLKAWELNAKLPPHDFFRTGYKYEIESEDKLLQMA